MKCHKMVCFGIGMFAAQKEDGFVDIFLKKANMRGVPCRFYVKGATFPASNHISILEKTFSWRNDENLAILEKSYWKCKEIMKNYIDGILYVNCGHFMGAFNNNCNNVHHEISMQDFHECPIEFARFMRGLSSASYSKDIFQDKG